MKTNLLILFLMLFGYYSNYAQDLNIAHVDNILRKAGRHEIKIPDIPGYTTLKCDFHIHTLFSDGRVWPRTRVAEAWEEGLDAIAITDHIENQPRNKSLVGDNNSSFDLASEYANDKGIILIKGGEISRQMPPGHLNAIFLKDVNKLKVPDFNDAIDEAVNQGAFIFWNHPGWKKQQPDSCIMFPIHKKLIADKKVNGIEVFNSQAWYPVALGWCLDNKLTIMGNSDIHGIVSHKYDLINNHRPITLVFSKNRDQQSIKEALFDGRTAIYFDDILMGKEEFLKAIFNSSVKVENTGCIDSHNREVFRIYNSSCIPYSLEDTDGNKLIIPADTSITFHAEHIGEYKAHVTNLITGINTSLSIRLDLE